MDQLFNFFNLVLLPGIGADGRLLEPQRQAFPNLDVPAWISPEAEETLPAFAARMAGTIKPTRPLILGGVSLGGMVAWEMAHHLRPDALVLISTCRRPTGLRRSLRLLRPLATRLPAAVIEGSKYLAPLAGVRLDRMAPQHKSVLLAMYRDADARFMRWALKAIFQWQPTGPAGVPVYQIHGANDFLMPCRGVEADRVVPGAGHLLNVTHASEVNGFIAQVVANVLSARKD